MIKDIITKRKISELRNIQNFCKEINLDIKIEKEIISGDNRRKLSEFIKNSEIYSVTVDRFNRREPTLLTLLEKDNELYLLIIIFNKSESEYYIEYVQNIKYIKNLEVKTTDKFPEIIFFDNKLFDVKIFSFMDSNETKIIKLYKYLEFLKEVVENQKSHFNNEIAFSTPSE